LEGPSSVSLFSHLKTIMPELSKGSDKNQVIPPDEIELINNLEEYFSTSVREIMVPRTKMVTIEKDRTIQDAIRIFSECNHTRIPVQDQKRDNIVGILFGVDLFKHIGSGQESRPVSEVMRKPFFASYSQPIHHLLASFKKVHVHLAVVVDEYGGVDGIVTLGDVIDQLVGDLPDESNNSDEPTYKTLEKNRVLMDADYALSDFNELYGTDFDKEGIETIGGYICHRLKDIPQKGETFELDQFVVTIEESSDNRIDKLIIKAC